MDGDAFEHFVARWRAVRSIASVACIWSDGIGDDVLVDVGRSDRELGRRCLWSGLAPPRGIGQTMKREFWPDPNANLLRMPHTFLHGSKLSDVHSGDGPENDQIVRGARSPRS